MSDDVNAWLKPQDSDESLGGGEPAPRSPFDDDADFDGPAGGAAGWSRRLTALAVVPWLVVAVLAVILLRGPAAGGEPSVSRADTAATSAAVDPAAASPTPSIAATAGVPTPLTTGQAGALHDATPALIPTPDDRVAAAAGIAVRAHVAGHGGGTSYVDAAEITGLRWLGDHVLVTVTALVLRGEDGRWAGAETRVFGVGVRHLPGDVVAVTTDPWPLPPPVDVAPETGAPVDDEQTAQAVASTLAAAGYEGLAELVLVRDPRLSGVLEARFTTTSPAGPQTVWLDDSADPALLGGPTAGQPTPPTPEASP